jgi:bifunctional DNase/RNase
VSISAVIDKVAPGRPCTHKPMREIIAEIKKNVPTTVLADAT